MTASLTSSLTEWPEWPLLSEKKTILFFLLLKFFFFFKIFSLSFSSLFFLSLLIFEIQFSMFYVLHSITCPSSTYKQNVFQIVNYSAAFLICLLWLITFTKISNSKCTNADIMNPNVLIVEYFWLICCY